MEVERHALGSDSVEAALESAAARLRAETGGSIADDTILSLLHTSYEEVAADASVGSFLPLLAERRARKALFAERLLDAGNKRSLSA